MFSSPNKGHLTTTGDGGAVNQFSSATGSSGTYYTPVCRFYAQGLWCRYGKNCKFRHTRPVAQQKLSLSQHEVPPRFRRNQVTKYSTGRSVEKQEVVSQLEHLDLDTNEAVAVSSSHATAQPQPANDGDTNICHVVQKNPPIFQSKHSVAKRVELVLSKLSDEDLQKLRETEIEQLRKRFRGDKLQELDDENGFNKFIVMFAASDPDWPYDVRDLHLQVHFPPEYPKQVFIVSVVSDERMPDILVRYIDKEMMAWLSKCQEENIEQDRVELMFRPFLKWFDRNLEDFFTEGLKMYQKQLVAMRAGLEFIPYGSEEYKDGSECGVENVENKSEDSDGGGRIVKSKSEESDGGERIVESKRENRDGCGTTVENRVDDMKDMVVICKTDKSSDNERYEVPRTESKGGATISGRGSTSLEGAGVTVPGESVRRGTEVRFRAMALSESVASACCPRLALMVSCGRCRMPSDVMTVMPGRHVTTTCSKCNQHHLLVYRPILMHHYSNIMGYLDLQGAAPFDLILTDSHFIITCLSCGKETPCQGIQHGVEKCVWCRACHNKLTMRLDAPRYTMLQVRSDIVINKGSNVVEVVQSKVVKKVKDAAIQEGRPLPDNGICKHYKKSYRWLRFPCCGKAYPCDVCHDEKEDHEMTWANRMICGYCAKEQPFSSNKPCILCNSSVTMLRTAHWEGGKGCRNKSAMSKNDRQKYASSSSKTVSNKKVGPQDKRKKDTTSKK